MLRQTEYWPIQIAILVFLAVLSWTLLSDYKIQTYDVSEMRLIGL